MDQLGRYVASLLLLGSALHVATVRASPLSTDYPNDGRTLTKGDATRTTSGKHETKLDYTTKDQNPGKWNVQITPADPAFESAPGQVAAPKTGIKVDYKNVLQKAFPDWTFNYTDGDGKDLKLSENSLIVHTYTSLLKINAFSEKASTLGAEIDVEYKPGKGDPSGDGVHWIQVIYDNHKPFTVHDNTRNTPENIVDNKDSTTDPYYDSAFFATNSFIYDTPTREIYQNHWWFAETFLVNQTSADNGKGGRTVDVYDGFLWGFQNAPVPEPSLAGCLALVSIGLVARRPARI